MFRPYVWAQNIAPLHLGAKYCAPTIYFMEALINASHQ